MMIVDDDDEEDGGGGGGVLSNSVWEVGKPKVDDCKRDRRMGLDDCKRRGRRRMEGRDESVGRRSPTLHITDVKMPLSSLCLQIVCGPPC